MSEKIELLAPGGDIDSIKAAVLAGADAIYCGLDKFNARNRAENITLDDLNGILRFAHKHNCKIFLTLNIIIVENEIPALITLLNKLVNTSIDAVIVQDLGMLYLLNKYFKSLKIHASTQLTTHNSGQIKFLRRLSVERVNLSRELSLKEIRHLASVGHKSDIMTEVFVHGSNCISFSGICYMSSVNGGNSGNRGRCSQPCRDQYVNTPAGKDFPLNLKDNSAFSDIRELADVGVDSIKIEGRIKKFHYVYTVVNTWKKQVQTFYKENLVTGDSGDLYKVFNRNFSNAFLKGVIDKEMFIDNPRDNSALFRAEKKGEITEENLHDSKKELYDIRTDIINDVRNRIDLLSVAKAPMKISVSGKSGSPLKVSIITPDSSFDILSDINLTLNQSSAYSDDKSADTRVMKGKRARNALGYGLLSKTFKALNDTEYYIEQLEQEGLQKDLVIPFKELTSIRNRILFILKGSKESIAPVDVQFPENVNSHDIMPTLSILISSRNDLHLCSETSADICFQLPDSFEADDFSDLFLENRKLIPWFPSLLIGADYDEAVELLKKSKPKLIVTNNTGIAYEAFINGIPWIAGPYLNTANSFSFLSLKENFNCRGAFVSNELSKKQIRKIKCPEDFKLYYTVFHPILLMTSRQCLFHQVTGCEKERVDDECIKKCLKSASITNLKNVPFTIKKTEGYYHRLYDDKTFLNTDIISDFPNLFSTYFIDLTDITTEQNKSALIGHFENLIHGDFNALSEIRNLIQISTDIQYKKGI